MSDGSRLVVCQKWEESEKGWGTRPNGYSLHLTEEDRKEFIREYWDSMPDTTPSEYSRPDGTVYRCEVDEKTHEEVKASRNGIRSFAAAPGSGGTDGWIRTSRGHGRR